MKIIAFIRSVVVTFLFPFTVVVMGPAAMLAHFVLRNRSIDNKMNVLWGKLCCRMAGVQVVVEGEHHKPTSGCVYLFNHSSFFDVFALTGYISGVRFGAKAELFKIPIFAQTMKAMGTLPIARNNRDEVYKIYEEAKVRFDNNEQFALSPEGGRFYGPELSAFKAGPFIFAMSAGVPLVPVIITGAYEALPKGGVLFNKSKLQHTIYIKILAPVETKNYTTEQRKDLQKIIFDSMNQAWLARK